MNDCISNMEDDMNTLSTRKGIIMKLTVLLNISSYVLCTSLTAQLQPLVLKLNIIKANNVRTPAM